MHTERALAVIPEEGREYTFSDTVELNEELLPNFLVGGDYFPANHWTFPQELDLPEFEPHFHDLYDTKIQVPRYTKRRDSRKKKGGYPASREDTSRMGSSPVEFVDAERSLVLFYNTEADQLEQSPIVHGTYGTVEVQTNLYKSDTVRPVLEMHTHPDNELPSPTDYVDLWTRGDDPEDSIVRGIAVACPDVQILVFATPLTPLVKERKHRKMVAKTEQPMTKKIISQERQRRLRIQRIQAGYESRKASATQYIDLLKAEEVERREWDGAITQSEGAEMRVLLDETLVEYNQELFNHVVDLAEYTNERTTAKKNREVNQQLVEFARNLRVEIFTATDMRHFTKWTA